ncbi:hypothetical protein KEM56_001833, partial [Ascosphaera pollenicola]
SKTLCVDNFRFDTVSRMVDWMYYGKYDLDIDETMPVIEQMYTHTQMSRIACAYEIAGLRDMAYLKLVSLFRDRWDKQNFLLFLMFNSFGCMRNEHDERFDHFISEMLSDHCDELQTAPEGYLETYCHSQLITDKTKATKRALRPVCGDSSNL